MTEEHWSELEGREVEFHGDIWRLTGDVELLRTGDVLALDGRRVDDVQHESARLFFGAAGQDSLNPGSPENHFDHIERDGEEHVLVVKTEGRTYRYELDRLEYE